MVDVAVSPLEHQQIGVARSGRPSYWHRVRFELVGRLADELGVRRIVDIGAGSGLLGDWLRAHRPDLEYAYAETSPLLRADLADRFGSAAEVAPGAAIGPATLVAMLDVIEHVEDDRALLAGLHERAAPDSHVVITVPAMPWAFSSWDTALGHHRRYSRRTLRDAVSSAGFRVRECDYLFPELLPLLAARKLRRAPRQDVEFPELGRLADAAGHGVASFTTTMRRVWPFGTSVVSVATRQ